MPRVRRWGRRRFPWVALVTIVLAVGAQVASAGTSRVVRTALPDPVRAPGTGCDLAHTATGYDATGAPATAARGIVPVACLTLTGLASQETGIAVDRADGIWQSPAGPGLAAGLAHSTDRGKRWTLVHASPANIAEGALPNCFCDPSLYIDQGTGRIFWFSEDQFFCGGNLNYSDDLGRTWSRSTAFGCPWSQDYDTFLTAPPVTSRVTGYPNVLYFCYQNPLVAAGPTRGCVKSTDGGRTAVATGSMAGTGVLPPPHLPDCSSYPVRQGHSSAGAPDGSIYLPVTFCSDAAVAISRDEGDSWQYVKVGDTNGAMGGIAAALDNAGNLYLTWIDPNRRVLLATSRDRGLHWSAPVSIAPAKIGGESRVGIAATGTGHVAVAYFGSSTPHGALDGYITETFDALSDRPVYWTASVNDPRRPLCEPYNPSGVFALCNTAQFNAGNRVDYIDVTFDHEATPWAAFVAECSFDNSCAARRTRGPTDGTLVGAVGSLQLARLAQPKHSPSPREPQNHHPAARRPVTTPPHGVLSATGLRTALPVAAAVLLLLGLGASVSARRGRRS